MAVSEDYLQFLMERLSFVSDIRSRRMFGGVGFYGGGLFFALAADNVLYIKVDDHNRPEFETAGMAAFQPYGQDSNSMQYYEVPPEVLETDQELRIWTENALDAARRAAARKKK